jgi:hypothetical protein
VRTITLGTKSVSLVNGTRVAGKTDYPEQTRLKATNYCELFDPPRAPARQDLQTPKPLPLPRMAAHRPPMLASSPALRVDGVKAVSVVATVPATGVA